MNDWLNSYLLNENCYIIYCRANSLVFSCQSWVSPGNQRCKSNKNYKVEQTNEWLETNQLKQFQDDVQCSKKQYQNKWRLKACIQALRRVMTNVISVQLSNFFFQPLQINLALFLSSHFLMDSNSWTESWRQRLCSFCKASGCKNGLPPPHFYSENYVMQLVSKTLMNDACKETVHSENFLKKNHCQSGIPCCLVIKNSDEIWRTFLSLNREVQLLKQ